MYGGEQFSLYSLEDREAYICNTVVTYHSADWEEVEGATKGRVKSAERTRAAEAASADDATGDVHVDAAAQRAAHKPLSGRLHLASRSVTFEPEDKACPVLVFPFDVVVGAVRRAVLRGGDGGGSGLALRARYAFATTRHGAPCAHRTMRAAPGDGDAAEGADAQHVFEVPWDAAFHEKVARTLQAHRAGEREGESGCVDATAAAGGSGSAATPFDYSKVSNPAERVLLELQAEIVRPLLRLPAVLALTDRGFYLQPRYSCLTAERIAAADVARCERRRCDHKDTAVELQLTGGGVRLVNLATEADRDALYRGVVAAARAAGGAAGAVARPGAGPRSGESVESVMEAWVEGRVSTLDYLMFLNWSAGRTTADLSSYPVVPWVLQDYTSDTIDLANPAVYRDLSLPMGALTPSRLEYFQERMRESQEPYLYGTHYSCPAYVLFYLLRQHPEWCLKLHNGAFDQPDRLFESVPATWASVSTQPHDLKELIPEFYCGDGGFLVGKRAGGVAPGGFGRKSGSGGDSVREDVALPPWCGGSAEEFVRVNRDALEGEVCSGAVHAWIDLVFGCRSRGEQAFQANNLFHPVTYDAAEEIDREPDANLRQALHEQVREFGQCPLQLFASPHPRRRVARTPPELVSMGGWLPPTVAAAGASDEEGGGEDAASGVEAA
eukprot:Rhum_TRINITY_DN14095_c4_g1::Rhum_TRINITY_DN14095_c4_g1_i1::g.68874::m.68874/K18953/NSMAF, FAN; factor associated with neutral sphingomyelinase activation